MATRIGEIIESSTLTYTAGTYTLLAAPAFGSLVLAHTQDPEVHIYGVVTDVRTISREPGGRAIVRGQSYTGRELYNEQIYLAHPDLKEVLQTEFSVWVLGYRRGAVVVQRIPHFPAPVHYSVERADVDGLRVFASDFGFLRMLVNAQHLPADELIAALIRTLMQVHPDGAQAYALQAGKALTTLLREDIDRVRHILLRVRSAAD
jgi:hypothetical protein